MKEIKRKDRQNSLDEEVKEAEKKSLKKESNKLRKKER